MPALIICAASVRAAPNGQGPKTAPQLSSQPTLPSRRGHVLRRAEGPGVQALGRRKTRATTWQQNLRPVFPSWEQKSSGFLPPRLELGECYRQAPREAVGPSAGAAAEATPAGPAPGSLFSGQEGGLRPTRHLRAGPLPPINPPGLTAASPSPPRADKRAQALTLCLPPRRAAGRQAPLNFAPPGGRAPGLLRVAGPAPTAGPCPRPIALPPRRAPAPRSPAAQAHRASARPTLSAPPCQHPTRSVAKLQFSFYSIRNGKGEHRPGISRCPKCRRNAKIGSPRPAPPAAAILYRSRRSGRGRRPF